MRSSREKPVLLLVTLSGALAAVATSGALVGGCGPATYTDMYFGSDAGADFVAPARDTSADDDGAGDGGAED